MTCGSNQGDRTAGPFQDRQEDSPVATTPPRILRATGSAPRTSRRITFGSGEPPEDPSEDSSSANDSGGSYSATSSETTVTNEENLTLPEMPEIDSSASTAYWIALRASAEKLKKAQRRLKKKKRHQKKSTDVLFRYLMKAVDNYKLPVLNYDAQPI